MTDASNLPPRARGEPEEWLDNADIGRYLRLPRQGRITRVLQYQDRIEDPLPYVRRGGGKGAHHRLSRKEWIDEWLLKEHAQESPRDEHLATPQAAIWTVCSQLWEDLVELCYRAREAGMKWGDLPPPPPEEAAEIRLLFLSALRAAVFTRMDELEGDESIKRLAYEVDVRYRSEARYARSQESRHK